MAKRDTVVINPMDLAKISWYANAIENWAYSVYAKGGEDRMVDIEACLKAAYDCLQAAATAEIGKACEIGWSRCNDGSCRPKCP